MERTRANPLGLDLHLELSPTRPARSLERALRTAITTGRLVPGTRLPAARSLAADLGIARHSVDAAYGQLAAEGWLDSRVGAGTWVRRGGDAVSPAAVAAARPEPPRFDLRAGIPDASAFPRAAWSAAVRRAMSRAPDASFGYPPPAGAPELREALAEYLPRTRGVAAGADDLVVTRGFGDTLALLARVLHRRGVRRIAVEAYGHAAHRGILAAAGLEPVPVPVDGGGARIAGLGELDVGAVLLTPAHQFPTGAPLAAERRIEAVAWAAARGGFVIEDDYDGEFRYDRRSIGALQALGPERVVYAGTASKALAPAVGLGWAAVPAVLRGEVLEERRAAGGGADGIHQLALAEFIAAHEYDRNVRRLRTAYRERRRRLVERLAERAPGFAVDGTAAGLQCLVRMPDSADEARAESAAAATGLRLQGLASFRADGAAGAARFGPAVVVGYAAPPPHLVEPAIDLAIDAVLAAR